MNARPKLAVLASGSGSNLQAILDEVQAGKIPAEVRVVLSDKKEAYALKRAEAAGVEAICLPPKAYPSREAHDQAIVDELRMRHVDWVILAGYIRILGADFVRAFAGKILNIHPALLPKYPGIHSIERAVQAGEKEVGVTVHFVDEGVDTGPIIVQEPLPVSNSETLERLTERVHGLEHRLYPEAIRRVLAGDVRFTARGN